MEGRKNMRLRNDERERLLQVKKYVEEHLHLPLTVAHVIKHTGLNRKRLDAGFALLVGKKTLPFIREMKMQKALCLLKETDFTIKQIAGALGYKHTENFSRAFTRYYGYNAKTVDRS